MKISTAQLTQLFLLIFGFLFICNTVKSQVFLPQELMYKIDGEEVSLRWEPASMEEWISAKTSGYRIQVFKADDRLTPIEAKSIKPLTYEGFNSRIESVEADQVQYYESSRGLMYTEKEKDSALSNMMNSLVQENEHTLDSFKVSFLSFYSSMDMDLAEAVGFGTKIKLLPNQDYIVELNVPGYEARELDILWSVDNNYSEDIPEFTADWTNKKVKLDWTTKDRWKHTFGYFLEKSVNSKKFERTSPVPILDPAVGIDGGKTGETIGFEDSLNVNYIPTTFRLRSVDYFGEVSKKYAEVSGYGFVEMQTSPLITLAEQVDDNSNTAHIEWKVNPVDMPLISHFILLRAQTDRGEYSMVMDSIPSQMRSLDYQMEKEVNHFRIEAVPIDGNNMSTMPVFVMGMDTIPPAVPIAVGAVIDTLGHVQITWHPNTEDDIWGVRVFRSFFGDDEYSLVTPSPLTDTIFTDTIDLVNGTDRVYYLLQAADNRNNRSDFSEPIIIEEPDIVPPGSPVLHSLKQKADSMHVHWGPSGSKDVASYQLFRKKINSEEKWILISEFNAQDTNYIHTDHAQGLEFGHGYGYALRATDSTGLISEFSKVITLRFKEPLKPFEAFKNIVTTIDKESNQFTLTWEMDEIERFRSILLYRGQDENQVTKYKYIDAPEMSYTGDLPKDGVLYFKLQPSYNDQKQMHMSDLITIDAVAMNYESTEELPIDGKRKKIKKSRRNK